MAALLGAPGLAAAQTWRFAAGLASEEVLRGVSLSRGDASLSFDAAWQHDAGWNLGLNLTSVNRDSLGRSWALVVGGGRGWQWGDDWSLDLAAQRRIYPGSTYRQGFDSTELIAGTQWRSLFGASLTYSPRATLWLGRGREVSGAALSAEITLRQRLVGALALEAGLGQQWIDALGGRSYRYANLGLAYSAGPVRLAVTVIDSRAAAHGLAAPNIAGTRWVGAASVSF